MIVRPFRPLQGLTKPPVRRVVLISLGFEYYPQEPITKNLVTGSNTKVVQPRISKSLEEQAKRTKDKAEVFTPSWVCNEQNNLVDESWFGRKDVFNVTSERTWKATADGLTDEEISFIEEKVKSMD